MYNIYRVGTGIAVRYNFCGFHNIRCDFAYSRFYIIMYIKLSFIYCKEAILVEWDSV